MTRGILPPRTLDHIRTYRGYVTKIDTVYKAHLRISSLEMERAKRNKEKQLALERIKTVEKRVKAIDKELDQLFKIAGLRRAEEPLSPDQPNAAQMENDGITADNRPAPQTNITESAGFKVKY